MTSICRPSGRRPGQAVGTGAVKNSAHGGGSESEVEMPPMSDEVIELYLKDVDLTLLRENLKLTPEQRLVNLMNLQKFAEELRRAGKSNG